MQGAGLFFYDEFLIGSTYFNCIFVLDGIYRMEHRPGCILDREFPCHVLQFAVDCRNRVVRANTEMYLQEERDAVGASPNSSDVKYCRGIFGGSFGALSGLRVRVLFCSPVGNFISDTGEYGWTGHFFRLPREG